MKPLNKKRSSLKISEIILFLLLIIIIQNVFLLLAIKNIHIPTPVIEKTTYYNVKQPEIMTVSAYTNRPEETNECPLTSIMEETVPGWTVAVSRDKIHWLGGRVYIEGIGVRRVNDLMNERFTNSLDLCVGTIREAKQFGKKKIKVVFLGN